MRDRLLLATYGAFSLAKKLPNNQRYVIDFLPYLLGKRESRRLMGDWVLNENDFVKRAKFEDAIASTSWGIDLHYDNARKGVDFLTTCTGPHYGRNWIPYRSIYSRNIDNLFMAGRNISVTHVTLGSTRLMRTIGMMGEVVGMAASICHTHSVLPRDVYRHHLPELKELMSKGVGKADTPDTQNFNTGGYLKSPKWRPFEQ